MEVRENTSREDRRRTHCNTGGLESWNPAAPGWSSSTEERGVEEGEKDERREGGRRREGGGREGGRGRMKERNKEVRGRGRERGREEGSKGGREDKGKK